MGNEQSTETEPQGQRKKRVRKAKTYQAGDKCNMPITCECLKSSHFFYHRLGRLFLFGYNLLSKHDEACLVEENFVNNIIIKV